MTGVPIPIDPVSTALPAVDGRAPVAESRFSLLSRVADEPAGKGGPFTAEKSGSNRAARTATVPDGEWTARPEIALTAGTDQPAGPVAPQSAPIGSDVLEGKRDLTAALAQLYAQRPPAEVDPATRSVRTGALLAAADVLTSAETLTPADAAEGVTPLLSEAVSDLHDATVGRLVAYFERPSRAVIEETVRNGLERGETVLALARFADKVAGGPTVPEDADLAKVRQSLRKLNGAAGEDGGSLDALLAEKHLYRDTGRLAANLCERLLASGVDPRSLAGPLTCIALAQFRVLGARDAPVAEGFDWAGHVQLDSDRIDFLTSMVEQIGVQRSTDPTRLTFRDAMEQPSSIRDLDLDEVVHRMSGNTYFGMLSRSSAGIHDRIAGAVSASTTISQSDPAKARSHRATELTNRQQRLDAEKRQEALRTAMHAESNRSSLARASDVSRPLNRA